MNTHQTPTSRCPHPICSGICGRCGKYKASALDGEGKPRNIIGWCQECYDQAVIQGLKSLGIGMYGHATERQNAATTMSAEAEQQTQKPHSANSGCTAATGSHADYLRAHGWREAAGMRDAWLDPKFRSIRYTDKAVAAQKLRDVCIHKTLTTAEGQRICADCGAIVNQNA
jgi:hypothetical protein